MVPKRGNARIPAFPLHEKPFPRQKPEAESANRVSGLGAKLRHGKAAHNSLAETLGISHAAA